MTATNGPLRTIRPRFAQPRTPSGRPQLRHHPLEPPLPKSAKSQHCWHVYPNLARHMVLSAINQLWVSDITYVRLQREFIYLAVILDVYSRRVVGWSISRQINSAFALEALVSALKQRRPAPFPRPHAAWDLLFLLPRSQRRHSL